MKKLIIIFVCLFSYMGFGANICEKADIQYEDEYRKAKVNYSIWEMMLKMYIDVKGNVNYKKFKENEEMLDDFLEVLAETKIDKSWTEKDKIAFWINVYNAYTIKLILNNYPVESIKDIRKPWDRKFFIIDGEYLSLGAVEHEILRKKFTEPRIHFAINCASKSCPRIVQIPYTGKNLEKLLERQTKEYINNAAVNDVNKKSYELSKLFSWFSKDFKKAEGSVINFINKYSLVPISNQTNKGFKNYDWALNTK